MLVPIISSKSEEGFVPGRTKHGGESRSFRDGLHFVLSGEVVLIIVSNLS